MIEWMLNEIICTEFEKNVGKFQHDVRKAMRLKIRMNTGSGTDQYHIIHLYLYAPGNYVFVAVHGERINKSGKHIMEKMDVLSYHDSCWRDAVDQFIFKNRDKIGGLSNSFSSGWYDVLVLTEEEVEYLTKLNRKMETGDNPFNKRGCWYGKV
jgi:hypothetical protein